MHPPQIWFFHVYRVCLYAVSLTVSRRCLEYFALELAPKKKNHTMLSQGALVATLDHNSTELHCGWRVPSVFLQQLSVDEQVHHPASTMNAWKLHAAAVQSACASEGQFLHWSTGDTAHHWDYCVQLSRTEPSSLIRRQRKPTHGQLLQWAKVEQRR